MSANHNLSHRTDIDGLRAMAVLPVLLYHARLGCPGGYVGVDIFFVISGYLITSLILKEQADGVFSLTGFWERRIRRIFPALALMLAGTFVLGWFMFLPEDFQLLAKSAIAQAVISSNVFFYHQMLEFNGYFGAAADTKPLLHTWSLSVEEQFYLFFPVLLILAARWRMLLGVVAVVGLGSFVTSLWYFALKYFDPLSYYPHPGAFFQLVFAHWHKLALSDAPTQGAFFLLPSRAWELVLGAVLALTRGKAAADKGSRELLGWLGLGMAVFAMFYCDDKTPYPGVAAVLPCLGAAPIMFSSEGELSLVGRLLSFKPIVFVGLISYSLYLWHWPLLVFDKYPVVNPGPGQWAAVLAVSFVLAILSWKYVETPFRTRRVFPQRRFLFAFAGGATAVLLGLGVWVSSSGGVPARIGTEVNRYAEFRNHFAFRVEIQADQVRHGQAAELGFTNDTPFDLVLWGDSHAMAVAPVINDLCHKHSLHGALAAQSNNAPVLFHNEKGHAEKMDDLNSAVIDLINQRHIKIVIMVARWSLYTPTQRFKEGLISAVQAAFRSGARVYVMKEVPRPGFDVPRLAAINARDGVDLSRLGTSASEYSDIKKPLDETFNQLSKLGATVLDPSIYFINSRGLYGVVKDNEVLYYDYNHLSVEGAALLAPMFEPIFQTNALTSPHPEGQP